MISAYRCLGAFVAAVVLAGGSGEAGAASKKRAFDACAEAIKKEFGASPIEFDKFSRKGRRNMAFGELTLSDGTKAQIRCKYKGGRVHNLQFRGTNEPGNMWVDQRPAAATFVKPKEDKPDEDKTATDEKTAPDAKPVKPRFKKVPKN